MSFLKVLLRNVLDGPSTDPFPLGETFTPKRFRGKVVVDETLCMGCGMCMHTCAAGAIKIQKRADKTGYDFLVWHNSCCLCASCRHFCPTKAITLSNDWHNAHTQDQKFSWMEAKFIPYHHCTKCGANMRRLPKKIAERIYVNNKDVDIDTILGMCPACRQMEDAKRTADLIEKAAQSAGENADATGQTPQQPAPAQASMAQGTPQTPQSVSPPPEVTQAAPQPAQTQAASESVAEPAASPKKQTAVAPKTATAAPIKPATQADTASAAAAEQKTMAPAAQSAPQQAQTKKGAATQLAAATTAPAGATQKVPPAKVTPKASGKGGKKSK